MAVSWDSNCCASDQRVELERADSNAASSAVDLAPEGLAQQSRASALGHLDRPVTLLAARQVLVQRRVHRPGLSAVEADVVEVAHDPQRIEGRVGVVPGDQRGPRKVQCELLDVGVLQEPAAVVPAHDQNGEARVDQLFRRVVGETKLACLDCRHCEVRVPVGGRLEDEKRVAEVGVGRVELLCGAQGHGAED